jgi:hypothetical protein
MGILIVLLIALLVAVVVGLAARVIAPEFERPAAAIAFLVAILIKLGVF